MLDLNQDSETMESLLHLKSLASKDISEAFAMPKNLYTSEKILEIEENMIFSSEWLCAGTISEIPNKGDYLTYEIGLCKDFLNLPIL